MNDSQKTRNNNNRKRGSHFEKIGADFLDMDVVPYSGSNARFGYGDVRDSKWLGEFKNISAPDYRYRIQTKWINDNIRKANMYELMPFLAWMPAGRADKYVILDSDTFTKLKVGYDITIEIPRKSIVAVNMYININDDGIKSIRVMNKIARLMFGNDIYYTLSMATFKRIINVNGLKGVRQNYGKCID